MQPRKLRLYIAAYEENKAESPIFVLLCVLCFQRQLFGIFIVKYHLLLRYGADIYLIFWSFGNTGLVDYMYRTMRKRAFRYLQTAKAQISIRAVCLGPSLSSDRIIGYYIMYHWRANARIRHCACTG